MFNLVIFPLNKINNIYGFIFTDFYSHIVFSNFTLNKKFTEKN